MIVGKFAKGIVIKDFKNVIKKIQEVDFSDLENAARQIIKKRREIKYNSLMFRMQQLARRYSKYIESTGVINWEENLIKKLSKKYERVEIKGDKIYLNGAEDEVYKYVKEAGLNLKKLEPTVPTEVTDFLGMIDDVYEFVAHVERAVLLSELYFLIKAMKAFKLPADWNEIRRDLTNLLKEVRIEDVLEIATKRKVFFETLEPGEFESLFGFPQEKYVELFKKLINFIVDITSKIKEMAFEE